MRLRALRRAGESLLLAVGCATVPLLSRGAVVRLARLLGSVAYRLSGSMRRVALANLALALAGDVAEQERAAIARESFRSSALVFLDLLWFSRSTKERIERHVRYDGSAEPYFDTAPLIVVSGHFGNWEVMGQAFGLRGAPAVSVVASLGNRAVDRRLARLRGLTGQAVAGRRGAVRTLLDTLRQGGRIGLVMDQNTVPGRGGEFVEFFGVPVPMSRAAASLAAKTDSPTMFVYCLADDRGDYTVYGSPLIPAEEGTSLSQVLAQTMEDVIRKYPGQWMWTYKRWKYMLPGADETAYPFYARPLRPGQA